MYTERVKPLTEELISLWKKTPPNTLKNKVSPTAKYSSGKHDHESVAVCRFGLKAEDVFADEICYMVRLWRFLLKLKPLQVLKNF